MSTFCLVYTKHPVTEFRDIMSDCSSQTISQFDIFLSARVDLHFLFPKSGLGHDRSAQ